MDRGSFSVEVIFTLMALKCLYPTGAHCMISGSCTLPDPARGVPLVRPALDARQPRNSRHELDLRL